MLQPCLVLRHQFQLFRLGQFQYHRSCRHLIMEVWVVCQMVFLVGQCYQELQWELGPWTILSWLIFQSCCHRTIQKLGWMGFFLGYIRLSLNSHWLLFRFQWICLLTSWRFFRPSCLRKQSFIWHLRWKPTIRVLWFIRLWKYQLRTLLVVRQS